MEHEKPGSPGRGHGESRPGFAEIEAARSLHPDSGAWAFFMREIVKLPLELTPVVSQIIRMEMWKLASDPLEAIRSEALDAWRRAWAPGKTPPRKLQ
jgi:hypothetical protein